MIDEKQLNQLKMGLQHIFGLKVSRLTVRELQNMLMAIVQGKQEIAMALFETLLMGKAKEGLVPPRLKDELESLAQEYAVSVRLAKEVLERGDFLNLIVSDLVSDRNEVAFLHRLRKVDGEECFFITDPKSTVNLLHHVVSRLEELKAQQQSKPFFDQCREELKELNRKIEKLASSSL